ncbi:MAG: aromatic amino acid hydroxylase [Candidatus Zixiibacteriota bacterium]|nr:MAG: aromatic amino acid hydroxylase [candidate division Zixibacteria bacterium]
MTREEAATAEVDFSSNPQLRALPNHLKQFVVEQNWDSYTPIDHAVWRFIMRQSTYYLKEHAHKIYFNGLVNTGINLERIPRISEMNDILSKIGWGAVAVDGFIPPAAFMEFQAYKVLVIACDMRQINHIEYTPAPDIVHEAAGHAPIIVDAEYASYLQRFGEIGAKAMFSRADFELYEAIRHLSILKERPDADPDEIAAAEKDVENRQANLGEPSEMARLSRLHWWTVEYGLIGDLDKPKIYGAGLLSSIGESVTCLEPDVKKIPYTLAAADVPFDITTRQPQLFVTPDFTHLMTVLEQFADTMAFRVGGLDGLNKAVAMGHVGTAVYSSGLQVSGTFTEVTADNGAPAYLRTTGPTALAYDGKQLDGHGKDYHAEGFGSPVGRFRNCPRPPETLDDSALRELGAEIGKPSSLTFESGVRVEGRLKSVLRRDGNLLLMTFDDCTVTLGDTVLFRPEWGTFDMAVGERIVSVFAGAADKDAYHQTAFVPRERTVKISYDDHTRRLWPLYQRVRDIRERETGFDELAGIFATVKRDYPDDWLLTMEMVEILYRHKYDAALEAEMRAYLEAKRDQRRDMATLIDWGFKLIQYHAEEAVQATSPS